MKYALENGMLDLAYMEKQIEMKKREEILKNHPYKIWEGNDSKWRTYLPDKEAKRRLIKRLTKKNVEDEVIAYWRDRLEDPTVESIYHEWINGKIEREEILPATKDRYNRQYQESMFLFGKSKIRNISEEDVENFVLNAIHKQKLTRKGYSNLRTILYGIFRKAKKKKLIDYDIKTVIDEIEISKKAFRKNNHDDAELVFNDSEIETIQEYIDEQGYDTLNLGILLLFRSGLRPGELAAIKWCDIDGNVIHVNRTEVHYFDERLDKIVYEVRDFPKTEAGIRDVIISKKSEWILNKLKFINPFGTFVFERNRKRLLTYNFSQRLETICKKTGIPVRSLNKIRKTYATILINGNVDESIIISQMGHTSIKTTKQYYYKDRHDLNTKQNILNEVIGL